MKIPLVYIQSVALLSLSSIPHAGVAQAEAARLNVTATSGSTSLPEYHPSFGDLMTMAVQPRHIKIGLAGKEQNWPYAAYEVSELRNAFARIARTIPNYQSEDTAALMTATVKAPLDALEQAISAGDAAKFTIAYAQMTNACNACHESLKHAAVVIKVPGALTFPDQDFRRRSATQ